MLLSLDHISDWLYEAGAISISVFVCFSFTCRRSTHSADSFPSNI